MKTPTLTLLLGLQLIACKNSDNKQMQRILFDKSSFDTTIKRDLPFYDSIKELAISNIDTLFKFRNNRNMIDYHNTNGKVIRQQRDEIGYSFFYNRTTNKFDDYRGNSSLPDFLEPKFKKAFDQVGREIGGFTLSSSGTLTFAVGSYYDEKTNDAFSFKSGDNRMMFVGPPQFYKFVNAR